MICTDDSILMMMMMTTETIEGSAAVLFCDVLRSTRDSQR